MPDSKCSGPCAELEQLSSRVSELQAQNSDTHREIFGRINKLERQEAVQEVQYTTILDKLNGLDGKVDALEAKPGKRWDGIVDKLIAGLVGAFATALFVGILWLLSHTT